MRKLQGIALVVVLVAALVALPVFGNICVPNPCSGTSICVPTDNGADFFCECTYGDPRSGGRRGEGCLELGLRAIGGEGLVADLPSPLTFKLNAGPEKLIDLLELADAVDDHTEQLTSLLSDSVSVVTSFQSLEASLSETRADTTELGVSLSEATARVDSAWQDALSVETRRATNAENQLASQLETVVEDSFEDEIEPRVEAMITSALSDLAVDMEESTSQAINAVKVSFMQELDKKAPICPLGTAYDSETEKCVAQRIQLEQDDELECNEDLRGTLLLRGSNIVWCDGEEFNPVYEPPLGTSKNNPAASCNDIKIDDPRAQSGIYFLEIGGLAVEGYCHITPNDAAYLGGNGESKETATASCAAVKEHFGVKTTGEVWLNSQDLFDTSKASKVVCFMETPYPFVAPSYQAKNGEVLNKYAYVSGNLAKGAKDNIDVSVPSGTVGQSFGQGDYVLVIQMQRHNDANKVGIYEYAWVASVTSNKITLSAGLQNDYTSGQANQPRQSHVTQIIRVPIYNTLTIPSGATVKPMAWNGQVGGIFAVRAVGDVTVIGTIDADFVGFVGGAFQGGGGSCQAHPSAGTQGESWTGRGVRLGRTLGGCCSGTVNGNPPNGYADNNAGGGGGGAGTCHGGGGGGGAYGTWSGLAKCPSGCGHPGPVGWGAPECTRSGWSSRGGASYGTRDLSRISVGSGGGAGNSYSPASNERNDGGSGGGAVIIVAGGSVTVSGAIRARGQQGRPLPGESIYNYWVTDNSQDGSGGGGSGGAVYISSGDRANVGSNKILVDGGACGARTGWNDRSQNGARGSWGRIAVYYANAFTGSFSAASDTVHVAKT